MRLTTTRETRRNQGRLCFAALLLAALLLPASIHAEVHSRELLITNVTLIDGAGNPPVPNARVLVRGGRIAAIGEAARSDGARHIDGSSGYLLPGLIDAHTHLTSVPGSLYRQDSPTLKHCQRKQQLQAYVAAGVTRVLDTAAPEWSQLEINAYLEAGGVGPSVHFLAPFFTPPEGYFGRADIRGDDYADLWQPVADRSMVAAHLDSSQQLKGVGVKVVMEAGVLKPLSAFPIHTSEMRQVIREETEKRNIDVYVHSMNNEMHEYALEMAPHALVHIGYQVDTPDPEIVASVKASGAYAISTIAITDFMLFEFDQQILDDPWLQLLVPEVQIATARDSAAWDYQLYETAKAQTPTWMPISLLRPFLRLTYNAWIVDMQRTSSMEGVKAFFDADIPIVMGADAGNWPLFVSFFHGVGSIREMELLVQAGLPPLAAIKAGTQTAARMLRIDDRVGTVEVGKVADLIITETNPVDDMKALRKLSWVIQAGEAKPPRDWITLRCAASEDQRIR